MSKKPPAGSWTFAYQTEQPESPLFILHVSAKEMLTMVEMGRIPMTLRQRMLRTVRLVDQDDPTWRETVNTGDDIKRTSARGGKPQAAATNAGELETGPPSAVPVVGSAT